MVVSQKTDNIFVIELILFWVCVGPSITYYYVCKLKKTINDYNNLYNKYEEILRVADDLHLDNVVSKKEFVNKITKATDTEYEVIEKQKLTIKELTKQRNRYKEEYIELKKKYLQLEEKIRKDGFLS